MHKRGLKQTKILGTYLLNFLVNKNAAQDAEQRYTLENEQRGFSNNLYRLSKFIAAYHLSR